MANQVVDPRERLGKYAHKAREIITEQSSLLMQYGINPTIFADSLYNAMISTPAIADCKPESVFKAVRKSCVDGLVPDGREAALVPLQNGDCIYMPMNEGLCRMFAGATGAKLRVGVVRANDEHEIDLGTDPKIMHRPKFIEDRGEVIFAWFMATMPDGDRVRRSHDAPGARPGQGDEQGSERPLEHVVRAHVSQVRIQARHQRLALHDPEGAGRPGRIDARRRPGVRAGRDRGGGNCQRRGGTDRVDRHRPTAG